MDRHARMRNNSERPSLAFHGRENESDSDSDSSTTPEPSSPEFEAKYQQLEKLGQGGFGCVFAGYRKADNLPVAIKFIQRVDVHSTHRDKNGRRIPLEVAIMLRLVPETSEETAAPVQLLDWYDHPKQVILVMERPIPCQDLFSYVKASAVGEAKAKIIMKQLCDAAVFLQRNNVFHRDIKMENILIETGTDVPRVRFIDFGLSCFATTKRFFREFAGTESHAPVEMYLGNTYSSSPTTVWQLGAVLFDMLHRRTEFDTGSVLENGLQIRKNVNKECKDFMHKCLDLDPRQRMTVEQLQLHPWLAD